jgi:GGDEF domain-containing protein
LTERLQERFDVNNAQANRPYELSISVGMVLFDSTDTSIEEVTARADRSMYENKRRKQSFRITNLEVVRPRIEAAA